MTGDCVHSIKFANFAGYIWQLEREQILTSYSPMVPHL